MAFPIDKKLVVGIASSALFDLAESDKVFREQGEDNYRKYFAKVKSFLMDYDTFDRCRRF